MRIDVRGPGLRPVLGSGVLAVLLAVVFLLWTPLGTDLSAQQARADFASAVGSAPVDLRWYGGTVQYGYSLVAQFVMAALGVRLTGVLAAIISSIAFAELVRRTGSPRPALAGALGAVCFFGNLVSGRMTYALGVAFGLLALLALTFPLRAAPRRALAAAGALLAAATSPVAGLFTGLAGVALASGVRARRLDGLTLALAAAVPIGVTALVSDAGGWMNISIMDTVRATVTGAVVALVVPRPAVRIGAVLSSLGVLAAFAVHTPVGLNATRLATMFAIPVIVAYAALPREWMRAPDARPGAGSVLGEERSDGGKAEPQKAPGPRERMRAPDAQRSDRRLRAAAIAGIVGLALWQPPVMRGDLRLTADPTASRAYFVPLLAELRARGPVGRIEVPPTANYWEAAHLARDVSLARGWLRQTDLARNDLFFDDPLTGAAYEAWLRRNGVSYVALPDARLSWVGRAEGELIRAGQPYLREVWRGANWTLYEVDGRPSIVEGGTLVAAGADAVTVDVAAAGQSLVRVRYSRWLKVTGPDARLAPAPDGWTYLRATAPGRYTLSS
jgi:hypothetical protein